MALTPGEISWIVTSEVENAARAASSTREVPQARMEGRLLHLEWVGQMRSFLVGAEATAEWLHARVSSVLSAMLADSAQPKGTPSGSS